MIMTNPYLALSVAERAEMAVFRKRMDAYIIALDADRKVKIADAETGEWRAKKDCELDHSLRPSDEDFFRQNDLWWKAFGS